MKLIDTHVHLNELEDVEAAIRRAEEAGVDKIIAVGMDLESNRQTLHLCKKFPHTVYPAIGYHPWSILPEEIDQNITFIEENLQECIALGEIGLDYRAKVKKPVQFEVFSRLLALAQKTRLPVIIHSRFSHERCHRMVKEAGIEKAVFHWYSGALDILDRILQDGYLVSATPALAYSSHHQAAMDRAPLHHILIETDAPVEYQGKVTEPADVLLTLQELARIKQMSPADVATATRSNAIRFFDIRFD